MPRKFIKSLEFARAGAEHAMRTQRNLWIHFFIGLLVLALAIWLNASLLELAVLLLTIFSVIMAEIFNTAIEELVNILSPEKRPEAALVKNLAAAAVLLMALGSVLIGGIVFIPKLMRFF
jgi:diacylglycerol kinase